MQGERKREDNLKTTISFTDVPVTEANEHQVSTVLISQATQPKLTPKSSTRMIEMSN